MLSLLHSKWRPLSALEFPSTRLPLLKITFSRDFLSLGCNVMRRLKESKDTISKGMIWLKAKIHLNKNELKDEDGTTYFLPNDVDDNE